MFVQPYRFIIAMILGFNALLLGIRFVYKSCNKLSDMMIFNKLIWITSLILYFFGIISYTIMQVAGTLGYFFGYLIHDAFFVLNRFSLMAIIYIMLLNMYGRLKYVFIGTPCEISNIKLKCYFIAINLIWLIIISVFVIQSSALYIYVYWYIYSSI